MVVVNYTGLDFNKTVCQVRLCTSQTPIEGLDALVLDTSVLLKRNLANTLNRLHKKRVPLFITEGVVKEMNAFLKYEPAQISPSFFVSPLYSSLQEQDHVLDVKTTDTPLASENMLLRELSKGIGKGVVEALVDTHFTVLFNGLYAAFNHRGVNNRRGKSQAITQHLLDGRSNSEYSSPLFTAAQQCVQKMKREFMTSYNDAVSHLQYDGSLDRMRFKTTLYSSVQANKGAIVDSYLRGVCPWFLGKIHEGSTRDQIHKKFQKEYKGHNTTDRKLVLATYGLLPAMGYKPWRVGIFSVDQDIAGLVYLRQTVTSNTASQGG